MIITKVLNNNAIICLNDQGEEVVALGSGIAFQRRSGDAVEKREAERIFFMKRPENRNRFYELISDLPLEYLELTEEIVDYIEKEMSLTLDETIYLTLADHIHYAVERYHNEQTLTNSFLWEIKHFYIKEYEIGLEVVNMINDYFHISLLDTEASFIAMHIINASACEDLDTIKNELEDMKSIINIVKFHYGIDINEKTMNYLRFITHLKFFLSRIKTDNVLQKIDQSNELFMLVCNKYFNTYLCVEKIDKYFMSTYHKTISDEEKMYLVLHIERVISNN